MTLTIAPREHAFCYKRIYKCEIINSSSSFIYRDLFFQSHMDQSIWTNQYGPICEAMFKLVSLFIRMRTSEHSLQKKYSYIQETIFTQPLRTDLDAQQGLILNRVQLVWIQNFPSNACSQNGTQTFDGKGWDLEFGEGGIPLHCHYSQIHFLSECLYLWAK